MTNIFLRLREQSETWLSRFVILVLLAGLFFVALGGISHNTKWQIFQVNVVGANAVSAETVRGVALEKILGNYFLVYARNNSYLFPVGEIEQAILAQFPRIASASIQRIDDHTLTINISERKPYALWCGEEASQEPRELTNCWFIDSTGYIFDHAPIFSHGVYTEVYSKLVEKNNGDPLRAALPYDRYVTGDSFTKLLEGEVGESLRIIIKNGGESELVLRGNSAYPFLSNVSVRFKDSDTPDTLIKNLLKAIKVQFPSHEALKKKLLYIDMRFGNKIFFGFEQ